MEGEYSKSDVIAWQPADVAWWLSNLLRLPQYAETFEENGVDGVTLFELSENILDEALCVTNPLHRKKILGHVKLLRSGSEHRGERKAVPKSNGEHHGGSEQFMQSFTSMGSARAGGSAIRRCRSEEPQSMPFLHSSSLLLTPNGSPHALSTLRQSSEMLRHVTSFTPNWSDRMEGTWRTPSFSTKGSFARAGCGRRGSRETASSQHWNDAAWVPAPSFFKPTSEDLDRLYTAPPRPMFGKARREALSHYKREGFPGAGAYYPPAPADVHRHVPGGSFGCTQRFLYGSKNLPTFLQRKAY